MVALGEMSALGGGWGRGAVGWGGGGGGGASCPDGGHLVLGPRVQGDIWS